MKPIRTLLSATLLAGASVLATAGGICAAAAVADTAAPTPPPPGAHDWHHRHGPWHMLGKLGLNAAQKEQIKGIMTAARPQMQSLHEQMRANSLKLQQTSPTDANYTSIASQVSQTHGSLSAQMMTQRAEIRSQVFKVLTPQQQTQLTALEAQMRAHQHGRFGGPGGPTPSDAPPAE